MSRALILLVALILVPDLALAQSDLTLVTSQSNTSGGTDYSISLQILMLMTVLTLLPAALMAMTSFTRIIIVLSILRQAIGLQQSPPNMLIVSLALFLTYFVMAPVFQDAYTQGIAPLIDGTLTPESAIPLAYAPFRAFMEARVDPETLRGMMELRNAPVDASPDPSVLIPSFMLSEVERAFQIGFLIFLPFLIIDLVVAAILMSMGMMMLSPMLISLPFKIMLFVMVDGWTLVVGTLASSFAVA